MESLGQYLMRSVALVLLMIRMVSVYEANAQVSKEIVIGAYLYNFAKLSNSKVKAQQSSYTIAVISDDQTLISELIKVAKSKTIEGKPLEIVPVSNAAKFNPNGICMIFVPKNKSHYYNSIFHKTKNRSILLVSESYPDKLKIMLNLFESVNGSLNFEMNKGNIFERQIRIDDEILLMGGSQVDLYDLYKNAQKKYSEDLHSEKAKLAELNQSIEASRKRMSEQNEQMVVQQDIIDHLNDEKKDLEKNIAELNDALAKQEETFEERSKLYKNIYSGLKKAHSRIEDQNEKIEKGDQTLSELHGQINQMDHELGDTNLTMLRQEAKIERQQKVFIWMALAAMVIFMLIILLFIAYAQKRSKNIQLEGQKEQISKYNIRLESNNKKINNINTELSDSINEIKRMQQQVIESEKMDSMGILTSGISHEINNPLNYIKGGLLGINSFLKSQNIRHPELPIYLNAIETGVNKAAGIVTELNQLAWEKQPFEEGVVLSNIIDSALEEVNTEPMENIKVNKSYQEEPILIKGHSTRLRKAFSEILENAIGAVDTSDGLINIHTKEVDKQVEIIIQDNGCGIDSEDLSRVMNPFFTTKAPGQGIGLGLTTAYYIIKTHHGVININSSTGKGTSVNITLPLT